MSEIMDSENEALKVLAKLMERKPSKNKDQLLKYWTNTMANASPQRKEEIRRTMWVRVAQAAAELNDIQDKLEHELSTANWPS